MALRDQPYLPLYVQDFLTDEKLAECSAQSTGVYIRLMCLMHKSSQYGCILLKQKDKQNESVILNFACKLARQMPYTVDVIAAALEELLEEEVVQINGDMLSQKRMVKDANLSNTRASARRGKKKSANCSNEPQSFNPGFDSDFDTDFVDTKSTTNTENENENDIESEGETEEVSTPAKKQKKQFPQESYAYMLAVYLANRISQRCPTVKPPGEKTLQRWADAFDKCNRIDGHDWDEIKYVLRFSQDDTFWQANILSGQKFREKYVQLLSKMQQQSRRNPRGDSMQSETNNPFLRMLQEEGEL